MRSADLLDDPQPRFTLFVQSQADQRRLVFPKSGQRQSLPVHAPGKLLRTARYPSLRGSGAHVRKRNFLLAAQLMPMKRRWETGWGVFRGSKGVDRRAQVKCRVRGRNSVTAGGRRDGSVHRIEPDQPENCGVHPRNRGVRPRFRSPSHTHSRSRSGAGRTRRTDPMPVGKVPGGMISAGLT